MSLTRNEITDKVVGLLVDKDFRKALTFRHQEQVYGPTTPIYPLSQDDNFSLVLQEVMNGPGTNFVLPHSTVGTKVIKWVVVPAAVKRSYDPTCMGASIDKYTPGPDVTASVALLRHMRSGHPFVIVPPHSISFLHIQACNFYTSKSG